MAEDSRVPPLPRRVPGDRRRLGTGPAVPPVLSDADIERIRNALNAAGEQAPPPDPAAPPPDPAAPAERPSRLPRRVPSASGHEPPVRPVLPPSSPDFLPAEAPAQPLQGIPAAMASGVTEEIEVQPNGATRPEAAAVAPADPKFVPAQRPPTEERPDGQDRREVGATGPEKVPVGWLSAQASRSEAQAHWKKALARPPKPALPEALMPPSGPSWSQELASPRRWIAIGVILAVVLSAGSLALVLTRHAATGATREGYRINASAEVRAASWVASQVNRAATVSCDQVMCQALEKRGVPAASLLELRTGQSDPLRSRVLVSTAAIRRLIGSKAVTADAPAVIASFGSGSGRIEVREIAQRGAAAYFSALSEDIQERKVSGTSLLANPRITVSAAARGQLAAGQVDSRLQVVIAGLAAQRPVSIVAFGDLGPGASPGIPFRGAYLAGTGRTAAAQLQSMSAFLHGQSGRYTAGYIHPERLSGGRKVLLIEFAAPSPQGLLGPLAP